MIETAIILAMATTAGVLAYSAFQMREEHAQIKMLMSAVAMFFLIGTVFTGYMFALNGASTADLYDQVKQNKEYQASVSNSLEYARTGFGALRTRGWTPIINIESDKIPIVSDERNNVKSFGGSIDKKYGLYYLTGSIELQTDRLSEYQAGVGAQVGEAIRLSEQPTGDTNVKHGLIGEENGIYFKHNATCTSVNLLRSGKVAKSVCQQNWNVNTVNGSTYFNEQLGETVNRKQYDLDETELNIYRWQYSWYAGGQLTAKVVFDKNPYQQENIPVHRFDIPNNSSIEQTSLPITVNVTDTEGAEDFEVWVGGRQQAIESSYISTNRKTVMRRGGPRTLSSTDTWYPMIAFRHKQGYNQVNIDFVEFGGDLACDVEYLIKRDTSISVSYTKDLYYRKQNETSIKVNTSLTTGSFTGSPSAQPGLFIDAGTISGGRNNKAEVERISGIGTTVGQDDQVTVYLKPESSSCDITNFHVDVKEDM